MARQRDEAKVEAIFKASLKLVLKEGFSGFKMSQVAKDAGLATGTLYIYFQNKEALINELYITTKRASIAALLKAYQPDAPFMIGFEKMWHNYLNYCLLKPEEGAFVEQYFRSPYLRPEVVEETDQLLLPIFKLIERGKKEKLVNSFPTVLLVSQLIGGINELARWHHHGRLKLTTKAKKEAFEMAWNSIRR